MCQPAGYSDLGIAEWSSYDQPGSLRPDRHRKSLSTHLGIRINIFFKYSDKTNNQEGFCPSNNPTDYITRTTGVARHSPSKMKMAGTPPGAHKEKQHCG